MDALGRLLRGNKQLVGRAAHGLDVLHRVAVDQCGGRLFQRTVVVVHDLARVHDVEHVVGVVDVVGDVLAEAALAGGELTGLEGLQLGGDHRAGGVKAEYPHQLRRLGIGGGGGGEEEADVQQRLILYRNVVDDLAAAVDDGDDAVVRLADERRNVLLARAGKLDLVRHLVVVDQAALAVDDVQVVARPCDDALLGGVVVGVGADLVAPLVAAGRGHAVQRRAVVEDDAVAEGRDVLAEGRADARRLADLRAPGPQQGIGDHQRDQRSAERQADDQPRVDPGLILLLFLVVHAVCAGARTARYIRHSPLAAIHGFILSAPSGLTASSP